MGKDYSYTNNWPPEPLVGNGPSADVVLWSALSLIALLAGTGALFAAFGRWNWLGWRGREKTELRFREPQTVALTKSQRATAFFWLTMTALFLVQTIVGAASAHYRADPKSFFGIDRAQTGDHGQDEERVAWPHSEVPRLFAGLAAVASTAAVMLMRGRDRPQPQQP